MQCGKVDMSIYLLWNTCFMWFDYIKESWCLAQGFLFVVFKRSCLLHPVTEWAESRHSNRDTKVGVSCLRGVLPLQLLYCYWVPLGQMGHNEMKPRNAPRLKTKPQFGKSSTVEFHAITRNVIVFNSNSIIWFCNLISCIIFLWSHYVP